MPAVVRRLSQSAANPLRTDQCGEKERGGKEECKGICSRETERKGWVRKVLWTGKRRRQEAGDEVKIDERESVNRAGENRKVAWSQTFKSLPTSPVCSVIYIGLVLCPLTAVSSSWRNSRPIKNVVGMCIC